MTNHEKQQNVINQLKSMLQNVKTYKGAKDFLKYAEAKISRHNEQCDDCNICLEDCKGFLAQKADGELYAHPEPNYPSWAKPGELVYYSQGRTFDDGGFMEHTEPSSINKEKCVEIAQVKQAPLKVFTKNAFPNASSSIIVTEEEKWADHTGWQPIRIMFQIVI